LFCCLTKKFSFVVLFSIDNEKEKAQSFSFIAITVHAYIQLYPSNKGEIVFVSKDRSEYNDPIMRTDGQAEAGKKLLYEEVADRIGGMIEKGTYRPGE
jgi:hypothetical protein